MARYDDRRTIPPWHPEGGSAAERTARHRQVKKSRKGLWILLAVVGLVFVSCAVAIGSAGAPQTTGGAVTTGPVSIPGGAAPGSVPGPPADPNRSGDINEDGAPRLTGVRPVPAQAGPLAEFGPGNFEIGVDIKPGKYKSAGPTREGLPCFAQTTRNGDGEIGDIAKQEISEGPLTFIIPAKGAKFFESSGCDTWRLAA